MDKLLKKSKYIDPNRVQDVDRLLIEIHRRMNSLEWNIPEISGSNIKLLKKNMET